MNIENFNDVHINEIRNEYKKINNDWLLLHYKITIGLVIFAFAVECFMGLIMVNSDLLTTTVGRYIWKFLVVPSGLSFLCVAIDTAAMRAKRLSQNQKIYTISLTFVVICFILFTAHNAFTATYYIFAVALILTVIYVSYRVTCITALASIAALTISEIFIKWDLDKPSIFESTSRLGDFLISLFILVACSIVCMVQIRYAGKKNEASIQMQIERHQLEKRLQLDEMTGTFNRKALHDALRDIEENASGNHYIFAIADIDNFKSINDLWGHHVGDRHLTVFAQVLNENRGRADIFRYGGDEFCMLFHNADMAEAVYTCEQIQLKLKDLQFEEASPLKLMASFGLAEYFDQLNAARLFIRADHALYEAKKTRNAIRVFQPNAVVSVKPEQGN